MLEQWITMVSFSWFAFFLWVQAKDKGHGPEKYHKTKKREISNIAISYWQRYKNQNIQDKIVSAYMHSSTTLEPKMCFLFLIRMFKRLSFKKRRREQWVLWTVIQGICVAPTAMWNRHHRCYCYDGSVRHDREKSWVLLQKVKSFSDEVKLTQK